MECLSRISPVSSRLPQLLMRPVDLAEQALAFHVDGMIEDGAPVPKPTPIEQIEADPDYPEHASILVPLKIS